MRPVVLGADTPLPEIAVARRNSGSDAIVVSVSVAPAEGFLDQGLPALARDWVEQGLVPDAVIRGAIRRLCARRLRDIEAGDCEASARAVETFVAAME